MLATDTWNRGSARDLAADVASREAGLVDRWVTGAVLRAVVDFGEVRLEVAGVDRYALTTLAHAQLAETLGVPTGYAARCRDEVPEIAANTLNEWLVRRDGPLVLRRHQETVYAVLSTRRAARPLVGQVVAAVQRAGATIVAWAHADARTYLRLDVAGPPRGARWWTGGLVAASSFGAGPVDVQAIVGPHDAEWWLCVPGYAEPDEDTARRPWQGVMLDKRTVATLRATLLAGVEALVGALRGRGDVWRRVLEDGPREAPLGGFERTWTKASGPDHQVILARQMGGRAWPDRIRWHR